MPKDSGPQNRPGVPPGLKFYSAFPFSGMNTNGSPVAIQDQEFLWVENFFKLGDGKFRTGWDAGTPLFRAPPNTVIVNFFAYTLANNFYFIVFLNDGSARQVQWPTGAITAIGGPPNAIFYQHNAPQNLPACSQYGVIYLLISNRNTVNDYWAWDGTLLYGAGTVAPNGVVLTSGGSNYNSLPAIIAFGGAGSGATFTPVINAGSVVNVKINNPGSGYEVGDVVQAQFKGGGSDNGPILQATLQSGGVAAANVTAPGSGYTSATVSFSGGGGGSGAAGTAIIGTGGVNGVNVTNPGSGYTTATVAFTGGGGSGATAYATIVGGQITSITIVNPGTLYTSAPTVVIGGNGTGATATATTDAGQITGITITAAGSGYNAAPTITITGTGTGATAAALLQSSQIAGVNVVDAGTGFFQQPLLNFQGGGGSGAAGWTTIGPTSVQRIDVLTPGQNYSAMPHVSFLGGPAGVGHAGAQPVMNGGTVGQISLFNGGSGYGTVPGILLTNDSSDKTGSGATARAIMVPHPIHQVFMSNYGLQYTNAPAVIVQPGANNAAYANIELMPYGLSGSCMETFQGRVWIANPAFNQFQTQPPGGDFAVTAAGSITDVAPSDGGVLFTNSDGFLQRYYTAIKQSSGYLYFMADGSVSVISGVQTQGNPPVTTFNYQNVDPQVGCSWRDAVQDFGRNILFANEIGVFNLVGGSATKASDRMDGVFANLLLPAQGGVTPSSAMAHIFDVKHYFVLMTVLDPDLGLERTVMLTFNGKEWTISSQTPALTYIAEQKRGSQLFAWGTDGTNLYPLFNTPNSALVKRLDTKFYGSNNPIVEKDIQGFYMQAQDQSAGQVGVSATVAFAAQGIATQVPGFESTPSEIYTMTSIASAVTELLIANPNFPANEPFWPLFGTGTAGVPAMNCGAQITTTSPDFILSNLLLAYTEGPAKI